MDRKRTHGRKRSGPQPQVESQPESQPKTESPESPASTQPAEASSADAPQDCNLRDVFSYSNDPQADLEKGIRAIAFLLEWGSEIGNEPIDGYAANGLSRFLHFAADECRLLLFTKDELDEAVRRERERIR